MSGARPPKEFLSALEKLGLFLTKDQEWRLVGYADLLLKWNPVINLVAPSTLTDLWKRHFLDSAQLAPLLPQKGDIIDLGSGGGFPALVLAILRPELTFTLVESDQRKAAFLREVTRVTKQSGERDHSPGGSGKEMVTRVTKNATQLAPPQIGMGEKAVTRVTKNPVTILNCRIEAIPEKQYDTITARALAPLTDLLAWSAPLLKKGGACLFLKGKRHADELTEAEKYWHIKQTQRPSLTEPDASVIIIRDIQKRGE